MSIRNVLLFDAAGRGTPFLARQWTQRGALQPFQPRAPLVAQDGTATGYLRDIWRAAFPDRDPLPWQVAEDGRGTQEFWGVFSA